MQVAGSRFTACSRTTAGTVSRPVTDASPLPSFRIQFGMDQVTLSPARLSKSLELLIASITKIKPLIEADRTGHTAQQYIHILNLHIDSIKSQADPKNFSGIIKDIIHELSSPQSAMQLKVDCEVEAEATQQSAKTTRIYSSALDKALKICQQYQSILDGKLDRARTPKDVLTVVMESLKPEAQKKGLVLDCAISGDMSKPVKMSSYKLFIAMYNLIENAIKYTDSGNINAILYVDTDASQMQFSVQDTGIGIPEEDLKKVLLGQRGSNTGNRHGTGYGLGRTARLLREAGGNINIESATGPPTGTLISITLPTVDAQPPEIQKALVPA